MNICGEYAIAQILDTLNSVVSTIQMVIFLQQKKNFRQLLY